MKIVICGVQTNRKFELAEEFINFSVNDLTLYNSVKQDFVLGLLTDYRVEIALGLERSLLLIEKPAGIFVESILDNVAHAYIRYEDYSRSELQSEAEEVRHYLTTGILYAILVDSLQADIIAWLPIKGEAEPFETAVDAFYPTIFEHFGLKVITLTSNLGENVELLKEAYEQRLSDSESTEEISSGS